RVSRGRHALRAIDAVITEVRAEIREVRFKGVEQGEGFRSVDKVEVSAEADGVAVETAGYIVPDLEGRLAVKVRVSAVSSRRERIGQFQVRLRGNRREIERAARILHAQLVHQFCIDQRRDGARKGLVAVKIVLERGRQVEAIVQWGLVQQTAVIDKIANEEILVVAKAMVDARKSIVRIVGAQDAAEIRLRRQPVNRFYLIDRMNVCKHC